ncbi:MAG: hypothetical protein ACREUE_05805 [Panacagrimonas sp.]
MRAGGIDRASFRAQRRQLLLDFEERETTTQPAAGLVTAAGPETTVVDPPIDPVPFLLPETSAHPERSETAAPNKKKSVVGIVISAIGAVVVLGLAGWWFSRPKPDTPAVLTSPSMVGPATSAPIAGANTPQSLATALTESEWTAADVANFLAGWDQLTPESKKAANEDSRIWLLRGETDRRLREARETESLDQSVESRMRIEQLELVQSAVATP